MSLTPSHQRLTSKSRIRAQDDPHFGPAGADLAHQPLDLVDRAGAGVDVRPPQLGHQEMVAAEDVERQIAIAAIVAVKEPPLLLAMQRIVGRVQVEHDLLGRRRVRVEEQVDEQPLDRCLVMADLVVACRLASRRVLEPVERRLAGQRRTIRSARGELAGNGRQHRVVPQLIVIDQILVAQRQGEHALPDQGGHAVLDPLGRTVVDKAGGEPPDEADRTVGRPQQQRPCVRGDRPAIEPGHHHAALNWCKLKAIETTLCRHRGTPLRAPKPLPQKNFRSFRAPMHLHPVRNSG